MTFTTGIIQKGLPLHRVFKFYEEVAFLLAR